MNLNQFLGREYHPSAYNCGHFVCDVWKELTGEDITDLCADFLSSGFAKTRKQRRRLIRPESPCLVVMQMPNAPPHVGVFINNKVIHLQDNGPVYQSMIFLPRCVKLSFYK